MSISRILLRPCQMVIKLQQRQPLCQQPVRFSSALREALEKKIKVERERVAKIRKEHGKVKISEVNIGQVYGGMRGILSLLCETSVVDPETGVLFRGMSVEECRECLPKSDCGEEPLPEGLFWMLLTGDLPTTEQMKSVSAELAKRAKVPPYLEKLLKSIPCDMHPMAQLTCAYTALSYESKFVKAYSEGVKRTEYWQSVFEDTLDIIALLPIVAAMIFNNSYRGGEGCYDIDPNLDWTANYCQLIGFDDPNFIEAMRLYFTIHADHEGGNVSAHTVHLVGSALSNSYLAYASGMNGLAGPLHGLANQEVLVWLVELQKELGEAPTEEQLTEYVKKTLASGKVVPGFGHAVLRKTDTRYLVQRAFAQKHMPDYPLFKLVDKIFKVVPPVLQATGKVQNPWPNVDAHSGVLLQYYGLTEMNYYTVLFAMSRAYGSLSSLLWHRIYGLPIERPKSLSTNCIEKLLKKEGGGKDCKKK